jgi:hypothetical protein
MTKSEAPKVSIIKNIHPTEMSLIKTGDIFNFNYLNGRWEMSRRNDR